MPAQQQGFPSHPHPVGRGWARGVSQGQQIPTDHRDIPNHLTWCSGTKSGGKEEEVGGRRTSVIMAFAFPNDHYTCRDPAFQDVIGHLTADGKY